MNFNHNSVPKELNKPACCSSKLKSLDTKFHLASLYKQLSLSRLSEKFLKVNSRI